MTDIADKLTFDHLCLKPDDVDFVIYHGGCSDGFGSALSAWCYLNSKFPERKVVYHGARFDEIPPNVKDKNVVICDFSYKYDVTMKLISEAKSLIVLDHHKTNEKDLKEIPDKNKLFTMSHSGAYITWRFFHFDKPVPKLIAYIQDNDLWTKALPNTYEFTAFMFATPMTFEEYAKFLDEDYFNETIKMGTGMVKQNNFNTDMAVRHSVPTFIEINNMFYLVGHVESTVLKSEIGNKMLMAMPYLDFDAVFSHDVKHNTTSISLRSMNNRTDVSQIAKLFNGGGHPCASGIRVNSITSYVPGTVHDTYKVYYLMDNIYKTTFEDFGVINLNSSHCQEQLGRYLLQYNCSNETTKKPEQVCSRVLRLKNKENKDNDIDNTCDISNIWNYDGATDTTWFSVQFNKNLDNDKMTKLNGVFEKFKTIAVSYLVEEVNKMPRYIFNIKGLHNKLF